MHVWTQKSDLELSHPFKSRGWSGSGAGAGAGQGDGGRGAGTCELFDSHQKFLGDVSLRVQLELETVQILSAPEDKNLKD